MDKEQKQEEKKEKQGGPLEQSSLDWLKEIGIDNPTAVQNIVNDGYKNLSDLVKGTPKDEELRGYGFNGAQKNRILEEIQKLKLGASNKGLNNVSWKPPRKLLSTLGANWEYQISKKNIELLFRSLPRHYKAYLSGDEDKQKHPLFLALSGAGTGKSRLLQEFQKIALKALESNEELRQIIDRAFVFNISFENGTAYSYELDKTILGAIGTRMLYQITNENLTWLDFKKLYDISPSSVISSLATCLSLKEKEMTVIICVDGIQKLPHINGSKKSEFYDLIQQIIILINQTSSAFVIGVCSATINNPIREVLIDSPQWRVFLNIEPINASLIFHPQNPLHKLLIDDMGGNGRALEALEESWSLEKDFTMITEQLKYFMNTKYPNWLDRVKYLIPVLRVILSNLKVERDTIIEGTDITVDDICSIGLISYNLQTKKLSCPFIWIWILAEHDDILKKLTQGQYHKIQGEYEGNQYYIPKWEDWEHFNGLFRCLRSRVFPEKEMKLSTIHSGIDINCGDLTITNKYLKLDYAASQYETASGSVDLVKTERNSINISDGTHFVINGKNAPAGDGWCGLKTHPPRREIHQYKLVRNENLTQKQYENEREKAAKTDDVFILYSISGTNLNLPPNSGLVNKHNFKDYYGPFSGRVFRMINEPFNLNPNTMTRKQLEGFPGIGAEQSSIIINAQRWRQFKNHNELVQRTKIPGKYLAPFRFTIFK